MIEGAPQPQIIRAAAATLYRIFRAPAVILRKDDGLIHIEATAGNAKLSEAETEAAEGALAAAIHMRGRTYPHDQSSFDMWPVAAATAPQYVIAVDFTRAAHERPADADRTVEIVAAYVVSDLGRTDR